MKNSLHRTFTIKDLGPTRYFLGVKILRTPNGLHLHHHKYILHIISDIGLSQAKLTSTPFPPGLKLDLSTGSLLVHPDHYWCLIGRLLYLTFTRPNITYVVQQLS